MKETKKSTDDTIEYHGPNILDSAIRSLTMAVVRRLCIVSMYCIYLDYLIIIGVGDASYKQDDKSIGGIFLFLANYSMTCTALIFWKIKQIQRLCH